MFTAQSYITAMSLYCLAALLGIYLMNRLWFSSWSGGKGHILTGLIGGLLLAPTYPNSDTDSLAPALIVVTFNTLFGEGVGSAYAPGRSLIIGVAVGFAVGVFSVYRFRWKKS